MYNQADTREWRQPCREEVHDESVGARRHLQDADGRARARLPLPVQAHDGGVPLARGGVVVKHGAPHAIDPVDVAHPVHVLGRHGRQRLVALHPQALARQRRRATASRGGRGGGFSVHGCLFVNSDDVGRSMAPRRRRRRCVLHRATTNDGKCRCRSGPPRERRASAPGALPRESAGCRQGCRHRAHRATCSRATQSG
jgi:hypothetical protein